jgi:ATP-dependent Zn protease
MNVHTRARVHQPPPPPDEQEDLTDVMFGRSPRSRVLAENALRRWELAFHESGHAIAAHVVGARVLKVSLIPDGDTAAAVTIAPDPAMDSKDRASA